MIYVRKVQFLKMGAGERLWRRWRVWRGGTVRGVDALPGYIAEHAPGRSFVDVGCMWGVNGWYSFLAEEAGATVIKGVDVFGPTPEFEAARAERGSRVEFILGDISQPSTIARVGVCDVVFCAGVLYHHPSPFDLLVALRRVCGSPPHPSHGHDPRGAWAATRGGVLAAASGRSAEALDARPHDRSPGRPDHRVRARTGLRELVLGPDARSCLQSLLRTAGFRVVGRAEEPFAQTFICEPVATPFAHRLVGEEEAREMGASVSAALRRP